MDTQQQLDQLGKEFREHEKNFISFSAVAEERYKTTSEVLSEIKKMLEASNEQDVSQAELISELNERVIVLETTLDTEKKTSKKFMWLILGLATLIATLLSGPAGILFQKLFGG